MDVVVVVIVFRFHSYLFVFINVFIVVFLFLLFLWLFCCLLYSARDLVHCIRYSFIRLICLATREPNARSAGRCQFRFIDTLRYLCNSHSLLLLGSDTLQLPAGPGEATVDSS